MYIRLLISQTIVLLSFFLTNFALAQAQKPQLQVQQQQNQQPKGVENFVKESANVTSEKTTQIKVIQITHSTPQEIISALAPILDKSIKLTSFKNQIIISADANQIKETQKLISSLDKPDDFYKISFLITRFPLTKNSYSTSEKVYSIQTQANKAAKINSDVILPLTKVSKDGEVSKEFKLFNEGISVLAKPAQKNYVVLNFGLINQTDVNKHRQWNKEEVIATLQAPLTFWHLVGEAKSLANRPNSVRYSTKNENFFYVCVEKIENIQGCNVK